MSIEKPNNPVFTEEDLEYICDSVCRYPYISTSEEEMRKYCEGCVITKRLKEEERWKNQDADHANSARIRAGQR